MPIGHGCLRLAIPIFVIGLGNQTNAQIFGEVDFFAINKNFSIGNANIKNLSVINV